MMGGRHGGFKRSLQHLDGGGAWNVRWGVGSCSAKSSARANGPAHTPAVRLGRPAARRGWERDRSPVDEVGHKALAGRLAFGFGKSLEEVGDCTRAVVQVGKFFGGRWYRHGFGGFAEGGDVRGGRCCGVVYNTDISPLFRLEPVATFGDQVATDTKPCAWVSAWA